MGTDCREFTKIKALRTRANMLRHLGTQTSSRRALIVTGIKEALPSRACSVGFRRRLQPLEWGHSDSNNI